MRALALSIMLERRAGDTEKSTRLLANFLRLYAESPYYAPPFVRERAIGPALVRKFLRLNANSRCQRAGHSLLAAMRRADDRSDLSLTEREREVLQRLEGRGDKEIAVAVGLSVHGVRYHLRKLFAKLGVATRIKAVRRARELGLIADGA